MQSIYLLVFTMVQELTAKPICFFFCSGGEEGGVLVDVVLKVRVVGGVWKGGVTGGGCG